MLPVDFLENMKGLIGEDGASLLESACEKEPVQALRLNPLKKHGEASEDIVSLMDLKSILYEESGYYFGAESTPGRRPFHDAGVYYIQDPGAMIPGAVLTHSSSFGPDDKLMVLDLCASPGGKSTQIASAMAGKGILFSNEIVPNRARVLSCNIERMGIANAVVLNESPEKLSERFEGFFDVVVVDAPCSGEGMFRKNSEALTEWSMENVEMCAERQASILDNAYRMLKKGGMLVYSTCTFEKTENEDRVLGLIGDHPDMKLCDLSDFKKANEGLKDGYEGCAEAVRVWPMYFEGEGHFAALMKKDGESEKILPPGGYEPASKLKSKSILEEHCREVLKPEAAARILEAEDRFRLFGDNLFIMPEDCPSLSGLKVLRCGLHIGTFKKDRFEPAHALALYLGEEDVKLFKRCGEDEAESFVKGMTLEGEGNGWCLISVGGYSLGWGKASGGRIKNHYPKGLRIQG